MKSCARKIVQALGIGGVVALGLAVPSTAHATTLAAPTVGAADNQQLPPELPPLKLPIELPKIPILEDVPVVNGELPALPDFSEVLGNLLG